MWLSGLVLELERIAAVHAISLLYPVQIAKMLAVDDNLCLNCRWNVRESRAHAPHAHYREFVDYGDAEGYRRRLIPLRNELTSAPRVRDH